MKTSAAVLLSIFLAVLSACDQPPSPQNTADVREAQRQADVRALAQIEATFDRVAWSSERFAGLRDPTQRERFRNYLRTEVDPIVNKITPEFVRAQWIAFEYHEQERSAQTAGGAALARVRLAHAIEDRLGKDFGVHVYTEGEVAATIIFHMTTERAKPNDIQQVVTAWGDGLKRAGFTAVVIMDSLGNRLSGVLP